MGKKYLKNIASVLNTYRILSSDHTPRQQCSSCFHSLGFIGNLDMAKSAWEDLCGAHANAMFLYVTDLSVYGFRYPWKVLKPNPLPFYCPRENSLEKHEVTTINLYTKRVIIMPLVFWASNVHGHPVGQRLCFHQTSLCTFEVLGLIRLYGKVIFGVIRLMAAHVYMFLACGGYSLS